MNEDDAGARIAEVVSEVTRLRREMLAWQRAVDDDWQHRNELVGHQTELVEALRAELATARDEAGRARDELSRVRGELSRVRSERDVAVADVAKVRASRSFRLAHALARTAARVRSLARPRLSG